MGAPAAAPGQEEKFTMKTPSVRLPRDARGGQRSGGEGRLSWRSCFSTSRRDRGMKPSGPSLFLSVAVKI